MAHKLIKDIDDKIWRKFVAYCTLKGTKVNNELEKILKEYLDKNFKKALEEN